ncbi:hypothetical protein M8J75_011936 [Diaphorina citri]|nr:hypothetical protein M8J75_011936 [Diaphorina citri]
MCSPNYLPVTGSYIVDSLPQGLVDGRSGGSLLLTQQQLQQLQQLGVTQTQEHAGALTLTLQHHTGSGLTPQLVLAGTPTQSFAYPTALQVPTQCTPVPTSTAHYQATSILQHHVRHSTIQTSLQQVMGAPGPLLQIIQPAAPRHSTLGSVIHKIKQPPQILPKPPGAGQLNHINFKTSTGQNNSAAHQNALLFNQMQLQGHHGQVPMLVQQQTSTSSASSGVQLILRSPSPSQAKNSQQQRLLQSQQHAQQVMRLITSGSLQLQQIQTSSGPTFIAVPTQAALQQQPQPQPQHHPQPATSPKKIKQTKAKKKKDDEQGSRLDLANLMRISGIEEEDVTPTVVVQPPTPSPKATPPPPSPQQQATPPIQQATIQIPTSSAGVNVAPGTSGLPQGLRLSLSEDGRSMVVHPTSQPSHPAPVSASVAAAAQAQLTELLAQHGSNILQNSGTATFINAAGQGGAKQEASLLQSLQVLSWSGSESVVMKSSGATGGLTLGTPGVVIRRPTQGLVLNDPRYITDLSRVQLVANTGTQEAPRYQLVTSAPMNNVITEQNRQVHIVTNVPQPSQQQHRVIEEQHQSSTTSHHQQTSATSQQFNKVHVVNEQQQRLHITSTLLEQQRVEILNEDQKVQLTSLLEQQKHITNLLNVGTGSAEQQKIQLSMGPGNENIVMLNQQDAKTLSNATDQKIVINSDGTINNQTGRIDLVNFQNHKNNLLNQKILINNDTINQSAGLDILNLNQKNQILNDAILNNQNMLNQKIVINNTESGLLTRGMDMMNKTNIPVSSSQNFIINNNGTLINTSGAVDLKELLQTQNLQLNNISIHTTQEKPNNHISVSNENIYADASGKLDKLIVNQKGLDQQMNGQRTQKQERAKKTFNDVYTEHLQAQGQQVPTSQYNYSIDQSKGNLIYINDPGTQQQQQHSPQSQQSQNKFLEQQHVNNLVFNTSISNGATSDPPSKHSTPSPCPSPMSFIPSKSNGPAIINDHTNRLQIVMDKPPTPTPVSYDLGQRGVQIVQMGGQGQQQQESQQLLSKQQLQIVMDSQDNSQIALNDHQNRLQIVMNQPSPESSSGSSLATPPSSLAPPPPSIAPPPSSLATPTRLNGSTSNTHVQFVSPRTVIKTHLTTPQPTLLTPSSQPQLVNSQLIPTSQSHPQLTLQPHQPQQQHQTPPEVKSPCSTSSYTNSTPPVFVNRPNLTVVTQPHPPVSLSSEQTNQVPFRSMPQVCDTPSPSVITATPCNNVRPQVKPPAPQPRPLSPPLSTPTTTSNYNSFLDSIAQAHPNILINKTLAPPNSLSNAPSQPATSIIVKKPPVVKKSAVVKPMVVVQPNQEDGEPPSLIPLDSQNSSSVVQRVQTIQLTPQKQQHLKAVQNQITSLATKDNKTVKEQTTLQKLYKEQQSILLSGKIVPTIPGQHAQGLTFVSTPVRLVAPPTIPSPPSSVTSQQSKSTSPICVQVGTQTSDDSKSPPPIVIAPEPPTPPISSSLSLSKRAALIEQQLSRDVLGATRPDTRTPFTSVSDAVKRLVRYHCLDDPVLSERDLAKADEIFEATAQHLLDKKSQMINKYKYLLVKESMRQVQTSELIMLGRMFVSDESAHLESLKQEARQPPPAPTLVPSPCIDTPPSTTSPSPSSSSLKRDRADSPIDQEDPKRLCIEDEAKRVCIGDDEEINAQVQSAIDSILNLQRSDPITDEAVRSILGTSVNS